VSCYFRHLKQIFEQAGVEVTKDNRQILDQAIHRFLGVEYKDCSPTWKAFKERIRDDEDARRRLIEEVARVAKAAKVN
jgi:hypothetical protein